MLDYDIKELGFFFIVEAWAKKQQQRLAHCVKSGRINLVVQYSSWAKSRSEALSSFCSREGEVEKFQFLGYGVYMQARDKSQL